MLEGASIDGVSVWGLWALATALFAIGEVLTPGLFFLGPLALAAGIAALVAALLGGTASLVAFVGACALSLGVLRPLARRHLGQPAASRTGTAALVGTTAIVLELVDGTRGRVKIGGEEWSARVYLEGEALEPGASVEVVAIDGATALVL